MTSFFENLTTEAQKQLSVGGLTKDDGTVASNKGGLSAFSAGRAGDTMRVNPYIVQEEEGFNSRNWDDFENNEHVDWLARGIAQRGLQKPLEARWDRGTRSIILIDGHCRLLAVKKPIECYGAEISFVLVTTTNSSENPYERAIKTISDNSGKRNSVVEKADQIRKLMQISGKSLEMVAKDLTVELQSAKVWLDHASIVNAAPEVKNLILKGNVSVSTAVATLKKNGYDATKAFDALQNALIEREDVITVADSKVEAKNVSTVVTKVIENKKPERVIPRHIGSKNTADSDKKVNLKAELKVLFKDIEVDSERDDLLSLRLNKQAFHRACDMLSMKWADFECLSSDWFIR